MNRAELAELIAQDLKTSKAEADRFIKTFTGIIAKNVRRDEGVRITGFGTFFAKKRKAKKGRNPRTGEELKIPAKWVPLFKAGSSLKEAAKK
ncbi:MAG: HU family DNA-binding protein [Oligoflexales bacterium]|nr:HU family DNA-binding protein [Oligoflexales bacterium]